VPLAGTGHYQGNGFAVDVLALAMPLHYTHYIMHTRRRLHKCATSQRSVRPHNPATRFRPPSATVVSAEPFSCKTGTLQCLQKKMASYRHWSVSLWRDPDDVPHCQILFPDKTERRLISATLCGWRRCFVADQLWFMTHIREDYTNFVATLEYCHTTYRLVWKN